MPVIEAREADICDIPLVHPERVRRVAERLTDESTTAMLADTFAALADTTRLRLIEALSMEEMCVCDLAATLRLSQSAASHQLRILRNLRIVKHRRAGRLVYYALDDEHVRSLFAQGLDHVREDRRR